MANEIDVATFEKFALLEDPYQLERHRTKVSAIKPFHKDVYVGNFDAYHSPDIPRYVQPSTTHFLQQALTHYELLKLEESAQPTDNALRQPAYPEEILTRGPQENDAQSQPNVFKTNKTWQNYTRQERRDKVLRAYAENTELPVCLAWRKEEVLKWLTDIGMDKYTVNTSRLHMTSALCRRR